MEAPYIFITKQEQIEAMARELETVTVAAVDLESDSMHHFEEKICLIQIYYNHKNVLIDPFAIENAAPLKPFFTNSAIRKVFHGADYDVRSLYRDFNIEVKGLFDTEIASRFLGYNESGLAPALSREFGLTIDKRFQKKDWSIRPLPKEMLDYAASDTLYLIRLAEVLRARLKALGRLDWVEEESALISRVRPQDHNGEPLFLNFKGAGRLKDNALTMLEALLHLRLYYAKKKDRAPFMIVGNQPLLSLATEQPLTLAALEESKLLSAKQFDMYAKEIVKTINDTKGVPRVQWLKYPFVRQKRMTDDECALAERLKIIRDAKAVELALNPSLLLTKAQMNLLAQQRPRTLDALAEVESIRNWQVCFMGADILQVLAKP